MLMEGTNESKSWIYMLSLRGLWYDCNAWLRAAYVGVAAKKYVQSLTTFARIRELAPILFQCHGESDKAELRMVCTTRPCAKALPFALKDSRHHLKPLFQRHLRYLDSIIYLCSTSVTLLLSADQAGTKCRYFASHFKFMDALASTSVSLERDQCSPRRCRSSLQGWGREEATIRNMYTFQ